MVAVTDPRRLASGFDTMLTKSVQVFVRDEPHTITVFRRFKARWVARGECMGKSLTVEDQTEAGAMARWRAMAESAAAPPLPEQYLQGTSG